MATPAEVIDVDGREVRVTNPGKIFFPAGGVTKMDIVDYYLTVAEAALAGCQDRPSTLYRWPNGVEAPEDAFFQKRAPKHRPDWIQTATIRFPSGRSADMVVVADAAHLAWMANLGCLDVNPWPVRRSDLDHPDELRIDLDPTPEIPFEHVREVALVAKDVLGEHELTGYAKTSGKRGIHIYARIEPLLPFTKVRLAALAFAREVERRAQGLATTAWWKEERVGVFVDYNQNARDRTIASAYSIRPVPDARVSCPIGWDEVENVEPEAFTLRTVPQRLEARGDPGAGINGARATLDSLLELAEVDKREGRGDAPWPPHFAKQEDEPPRAQPSRRKKA
ncbi:DNA polymerase domain-containing protein [soil metagenome]